MGVDGVGLSGVACSGLAVCSGLTWDGTGLGAGGHLVDSATPHLHLCALSSYRWSSHVPDPASTLYVYEQYLAPPPPPPRRHCHSTARPYLHCQLECVTERDSALEEAEGGVCLREELAAARSALEKREKKDLAAASASVSVV